MAKRILVVVTVIVSIMAMESIAPADVPQLISFQGKLHDNAGNPLTGQKSITFRLYTAESGGTNVWSETKNVTCDDGLYNVILGQTNPITLGFDGQYWLGAQVAGDSELSPRYRLVSVPTALRAEDANSVNGIPASITPAANTLFPLGPDAKFPAGVLPSNPPPGPHAATHNEGGSDAVTVTGSLIQDETVSTPDLANNAVTTAKIQPDVVSSVDGVANDGGNIDLIPQNAVTITPNNLAKTITVGETHSARTDNPHNTTATQTGALVSVEGVSNPGGNINLVPGSSIAISHDDVANTITISSDSWSLDGNSDTTPGSDFLGTRDNVALELKVNSSRAFRLEPTTTSINIIGGYHDNSVTSGVHGATISGGGAYGSLNLVTDNFGTVGGGLGNQAGNNAGRIDDVTCATVGGGAGNNAEGYASTIPGGTGNLAKGNYSFAAGHRAKANHNGSFVWGDFTDADVASAVANQFVVRANGGVHFRDSQEMRMSDNADVMLVLEADMNNVNEDDNPGILFSQDGGVVEGFLGYAENTNRLILENRYDDRLMLKSSGGIYLYTNDALTTGMCLSAGGSGWNAVSDRAMKENIRKVDGKDILNRLSGVPISQWNYKTQNPSIEHIGPMAQDFHEAFGFDEDDKSINSIDSDGVALAAIQGLYEVVKEKDVKITTQQQQIDTQQKQITVLEARLAALEARMK